MSKLPFYADPVFYWTLLILNFYWFAGLRSAKKNGMATPRQMLQRMPRGLPWTAHSGFWYLLLIVQPVLAWATAKMWPLWHHRAATLIICVLVGQWAGYLAQSDWSRRAKSSDAWSHDGLPNNTGIIHIMHAGPEIGILLMLLLSAVHREMTMPMFFGILLLVVNFITMGQHWPLRICFPTWRPEVMTKRPHMLTAVILTVVSFILLIGGIRLLVDGRLF